MIKKMTMHMTMMMMATHLTVTRELCQIAKQWKYKAARIKMTINQTSVMLIMVLIILTNKNIYGEDANDLTDTKLNRLTMIPKRTISSIQFMYQKSGVHIKPPTAVLEMKI